MLLGGTRFRLRRLWVLLLLLLLLLSSCLWSKEASHWGGGTWLLLLMVRRKLVGAAWLLEGMVAGIVKHDYACVGRAWMQNCV